MKIRVRGDLVWIRPDAKPERSEGGILLVHDRQKTVDRGTVIALGDGPRTSKGALLPHVVSVGEHVIFSPDAGEEVIFEKESVIVMREEQILGVVEESQ